MDEEVLGMCVCTYVHLVSNDDDEYDVHLCKKEGQVVGQTITGVCIYP